MAEAINDEVVRLMLVSDLQEHREYTMLEAEAWVRNNGECVVNDMWEAYTKYIEDNADYKGKENE